MKTPRCLLALLLSAARLSAAELVEDWPQFLGPRGNNTSRETGLLDKFPKDGPPLVWQRDIGTGYSAPSVRGELLVLHHRVKDEEVVEAMHPATGKPAWRYAYPSRYQDPYGYNNGPRCTPLLTKTRVYTLNPEGKLFCLDLVSGKQIWARDCSKDFQIPDDENFFGVGCTPILGSAADFAKLIAGETEKWSNVVKFSGAKAE